MIWYLQGTGLKYDGTAHMDILEGSIIGYLPLVYPMVQRSLARISMIWMLQGTGLEYMIP